jgi:hypothetical protein
MHEIKPLSLKLKISIRDEIRAIATLMGYTEHGFIVESVKAILRMVQMRDTRIPPMVVMAWSIHEHMRSPVQLTVSASPGGADEDAGTLSNNTSLSKSSVEDPENRRAPPGAVAQSSNAKTKTKKCT